jgi:hypothetical protein
MFDIIAKIGTSGAIGFLIGLFVVWWIAPQTSGGIMILIIISVLASTTAGGIFSAFTRGNKSNAEINNKSTDY